MVQNEKQNLWLNHLRLKIRIIQTFFNTINNLNFLYTYEIFIKSKETVLKTYNIDINETFFTNKTCKTIINIFLVN